MIAVWTSNADLCMINCFCVVALRTPDIRTKCNISSLTIIPLQKHTICIYTHIYIHIRTTKLCYDLRKWQPLQEDICIVNLGLLVIRQCDVNNLQNYNLINWTPSQRVGWVHNWNFYGYYVFISRENKYYSILMLSLFVPKIYKIILSQIKAKKSNPTIKTKLTTEVGCRQ